MRILLLIVFGLLGFVYAQSQNLEVYDTYDSFNKNLIQNKDKVYVINYWATWCAPCIKELPYFEKLNDQYSDNEVEVVLVSLDFENQRERSLIPFLKRKNLKSRVIHMSDPKFNKWIGLVNDDWSGAIPATEFIKGDRELFREKEYPSYESLKKDLDQFIQL